MITDLPPIQLIRIRNEVDRFGFSYFLSKQYGLANTPRSFAAYLHGWIWRRDFKLTDMGYNLMPHSTPVVVATKWQRNVLLSYKFTNVIAGGLPFSYIDKSDIERKSASLLIMPPHSIEHCSYSGINALFLNFIDSIRAEFSEICFCLHADDESNKKITDILQKRGFNYIIGAHHGDRNSLIRMRKIFDYYDYVATTIMGSHILYAAFCGCKVSLLDDHFDITPEQAYDHELMKADFLEFKAQSLDVMNNRVRLNEQFPWLFVKHPKEAVQMMEWAKEEIGANNLVDKDLLMNFLGWTFSAKINAMMRIALRRFTDLIVKVTFS